MWIFRGMFFWNVIFLFWGIPHKIFFYKRVCGKSVLDILKMSILVFCEIVFKMEIGGPPKMRFCLTMQQN